MTAYTNEDFGIRSNGDRAAVLNALLKSFGKKLPVAKLAPLARGKSTTRVARIVNRIEAKAKTYKLPVAVVREDTETGRVYGLVRKASKKKAA